MEVLELEIARADAVALEVGNCATVLGVQAGIAATWSTAASTPASTGDSPAVSVLRRRCLQPRRSLKKGTLMTKITTNVSVGLLALGAGGVGTAQGLRAIDPRPASASGRPSSRPGTSPAPRATTLSSARRARIRSTRWEAMTAFALSAGTTQASGEGWATTPSTAAPGTGWAAICAPGMAYRGPACRGLPDLRGRPEPAEPGQRDYGPPFQRVPR